MEAGRPQNTKGHSRFIRTSEAGSQIENDQMVMGFQNEIQADEYIV